MAKRLRKPVIGEEYVVEYLIGTKYISEKHMMRPYRMSDAAQLAKDLAVINGSFNPKDIWIQSVHPSAWDKKKQPRNGG